MNYKYELDKRVQTPALIKVNVRVVKSKQFFHTETDAVKSTVLVFSSPV